jgi:hypothetical protein
MNTDLGSNVCISAAGANSTASNPCLFHPDRRSPEQKQKEQFLDSIPETVNIIEQSRE